MKMNEFVWAVSKRFLRVFISGAISSLSIFLLASSPQDALKEPGVYLLSVAIAAVTGGLAALDKALRWKE